MRLLPTANSLALTTVGVKAQTLKKQIIAISTCADFPSYAVAAQLPSSRGSFVKRRVWVFAQMSKNFYCVIIALVSVYCTYRFAVLTALRADDREGFGVSRRFLRFRKADVGSSISLHGFRRFVGRRCKGAPASVQESLFCVVYDVGLSDRSGAENE